MYSFFLKDSVEFIQQHSLSNSLIHPSRNEIKLRLIMLYIIIRRGYRDRFSLIKKANLTPIERVAIENLKHLGVNLNKDKKQKESLLQFR
jgi:hypothetical protein